MPHINSEEFNGGGSKNSRPLLSCLKSQWHLTQVATIYTSTRFTASADCGMAFPVMKLAHHGGNIWTRERENHRGPWLKVSGLPEWHPTRTEW